MSEYVLYLHCKPNMEPFYVGIGTLKRSADFSRRNAHHKAIVKKHGSRNIRIFRFECGSRKEAFSDEVQIIAQLRAEGWNLANKSMGGEVGPRGCIRSPETRAKLSAASMGQRHTEATKRLIGAASASRAGCYKHTPESLAKMSAARRGRPCRPEHYLALSAKLKGRPWSEARWAAERTRLGGLVPREGKR